jgi:formimidoylglutamate deiminase
MYIHNSKDGVLSSRNFEGTRAAMTHSLHFAEALLPDGWGRDVRIDIEGGIISSVGSGAAGAERFAVGLPGLPNLHSHAFQRGMAALAERRSAEPDSFWSWREVMYRFLAVLTPQDVEAVAAMAYAEMLEGGFTRVGEFHYLHNQPGGGRYDDAAEMAARIAAAADATGIALTLLPVFYAHANFGGTAPAPGQARFVTDHDGYARLLAGSAAAVRWLPDAVLGVAPHSLRAVTLEELGEVVALAGGGPVHIHAAEQLREVEDCVAWCGARPVELLVDRAGVGPGWCVVHATHMTAEETRRLAGSGAVAGLCPITEASLGDGIFDGAGWRQAGGRFGVGSDSNIQIGAADELRMLEYSQRLATRRRNVLAAGPGATTGRSLVDAVLVGGAAALGVEPPALRAGAVADIVALDASHVSLAGRHANGWLDGWIFAAPAAIDTVWRRGRAVVRQGRHIGRERIERAYRIALTRLMA